MSEQSIYKLSLPEANLRRLERKLRRAETECKLKDKTTM